MSDLFSVSGSLNRGRYAMAVFLKIIPLAFIVSGAAIAYYGNSHAEVMEAVRAQDKAALKEFLGYVAKASGISFLIALLLGVNVSVKRLRNIWVSAWLAILTFVPVINLFFLIYLLAVKWDGLDDYAHDEDAMPLGFKAIFGLSLISLAGVVMTYWLWRTKGVIWAQFGPNVLTWTSAALTYAAIGILNGSVAYGVYKRKEWAYFAIMGLSLIEIVLSSANYFFVSKNPEIMVGYYRIMNVPNVPAHEAIVSSMAYGTGFAIAAWLFFIFYVNKNLNYFTE